MLRPADPIRRAATARSGGPGASRSLRALWTGRALAVRWDIVLGCVCLVVGPFAVLYLHERLGLASGTTPPADCWWTMAAAATLALAYIGTSRFWRGRMHRRQAALVDSALDALGEGFVIVDPEGQLVSCNRAAERMLGPAPPHGDVFAWIAGAGYGAPRARDGGERPHPLRLALEGHAAGRVAWTRPGRSRGATHTLILTARPFPLQQVRGAVLVLRDVSARMRVAASHRRLSRAIEQTADMVVITDREGVIQYANPALTQVTGYAPAEVLGKTPTVLRSGLHPTAYFERLWRTILAGEVFRGAIVNRRKDGSLYTAEQTITPVKDAAGRLTHFVSVSKDMTQVHQMRRRAVELEVAAAIQRRFFPAEAPEVPGLDIAGQALPAEETSGDLYDLVPRPDGRLLVAVGDVSGHGVGPALLMSEVRAYLRAMAGLALTPAEILTRIDGLLRPDLGDGAFVTLLLVEIDTTTREFAWANAGHVDGLRLAPEGVLREHLGPTGPALGVLDAPAFGLRRGAALAPGEVLLLVTDGVTESPGHDGAPLEEEGLLHLLPGLLVENARSILVGLQRSLLARSSDRPARDDVTMVVIKSLGTQGGE